MTRGGKAGGRERQGRSAVEGQFRTFLNFDGKSRIIVLWDARSYRMSEVWRNGANGMVYLQKGRFYCVRESRVDVHACRYSMENRRGS
jgi:hypothetical protein